MAYNATTLMSTDRRTKPAVAASASRIAVRRARLLAKPPASRAAPAALRRLGRPATVDEVTVAARRYPRTAIHGALRSSCHAVQVNRGLWLAASCTGLEADDLRRLRKLLDVCSDDDGLIDEQLLAARSAGEPWAGRIEELAAATGCVRVVGLLCRSETRRAVSKAAMVHFGVRATPAEVAEATGHPFAAIAAAMSQSPDILPEGDGTWSLAPPGYRAVVDALRDHRGDYSLVAQDKVAAALGYAGWTEQLETLAVKAGCVRLFGRLFRCDYPITLVFGTLLAIGRFASCAEIAETLNAEVPARHQLTVAAVHQTCGSRGLFERNAEQCWRIEPDVLREMTGSDDVVVAGS